MLFIYQANRNGTESVTFVSRNEDKVSGECVFILVENGVALWSLCNFLSLFLLSPGLSAWPIFNLYY